MPVEMGDLQHWNLTLPTCMTWVGKPWQMVADYMMTEFAGWSLEADGTLLFLMF